jgi:hypothetical protein
MPETTSWDWHSTPIGTCYLSYSNLAELACSSTPVVFLVIFAVGQPLQCMWCYCGWKQVGVGVLSGLPQKHNFLLFQCDCHLNSEFKVPPPKTLKVKTSGSHWNELGVFELFFNSIWCFYGEVWNILLKFGGKL